MSAPGLLQRVELAVVDWFLKPAPVATLALIRIMLGLVMVACMVQYIPDVEWLFGYDGLLANVLKRYPDHPLRHHTWLVFGLLTVSSVSFTLGFATRISGLTAAVMQATVASSGYFHSWGWSTVMPVVLAIVALSPGRNAWSVDAWIAERRGRPLPRVAPRWSLRLLQVHVMAIYIAAGWHRINDVGWINGEMVYAAVANSMYTRLPYIDPQPLKPVFSVMTWATEIIELVAPFFLWVRKARVPVALGLVLLHLGLELSATIGYWQFMMMTLLWVFLPVSWAEGALRRLRIPGAPGPTAG